MAKTKRMSRQWTRDEGKEKFWMRKLFEHASSGISISEFCRRENISANSFNSWRRELLIRERERAASGLGTPSQLPTFPDKVKDSRGRTIPNRVSKWLAENKKDQSTHNSQSPFVSLKLVDPPISTSNPAPLIAPSSIEVVSPSGFILRLSGEIDSLNLKKLIAALEK
jgi:transposase-like protein